MKTIHPMMLAAGLAICAVGCSTGASVNTPIVDVDAGGAVGR